MDRLSDTQFDTLADLLDRSMKLSRATDPARVDREQHLLNLVNSRGPFHVREVMQLSQVVHEAIHILGRTPEYADEVTALKDIQMIVEGATNPVVEI